METPRNTKRIKLRLEFDGSTFCGWQLQADAHESKFPSIQGTLESALSTVMRRPTERFVIQGCGRTDAGVHAEEFFCHFDAPEDEIKDLERFRHGLNCVLPDHVVVNAAWEAPGFHALNDVTRKIYEYRILIRRAKPVLRLGRCLWLPLEPFNPAYFDVDPVRAALKIFEGEHDFKAFAAANASTKTSVRELLSCELISEPENGDPLSGQLVRIRFEGTGFLKQMVRNMVGTLIEIGQRRRSVDSIAELLGHGGTVGTRPDSGPCAVADGLFLSRVKYG